MNQMQQDKPLARGISIGLGEFVYGKYIKIYDEHYIAPIKNKKTGELSHSADHAQIREDTLSFDTGIRDEDGHRIFETDHIAITRERTSKSAKPKRKDIGMAVLRAVVHKGGTVTDFLGNTISIPQLMKKAKDAAGNDYSIFIHRICSDYEYHHPTMRMK